MESGTLETRNLDSKSNKRERRRERGELLGKYGEDLEEDELKEVAGEGEDEAEEDLDEGALLLVLLVQASVQEPKPAPCQQGQRAHHHRSLVHHPPPRLHCCRHRRRTTFSTLPRTSSGGSDLRIVRVLNHLLLLCAWRAVPHI